MSHKKAPFKGLFYFIFSSIYVVNLLSHIAGISTNGSSRKKGQPFFHLPFFLKNLNSSKSFLSPGSNSLRGLNERRNVDRFMFIIKRGRSPVDYSEIADKTCSADTSLFFLARALIASMLGFVFVALTLTTPLLASFTLSASVSAIVA